MDTKRAISLSKFLSYVLRHNPGSIGIDLGEGGWVDVGDLLAAANRSGTAISAEELREIVATSDKQRFTLNPDGTCIRAAQGHSTEVDLGLDPAYPPRTLFHGTASHTIGSILSEGLKPGSRRHVHLSPDIETALQVGQRHGKPVVLAVDCIKARAVGVVFYRADNGVWLTGPLPPEVLSLVAAVD